MAVWYSLKDTNCPKQNCYGSTNTSVWMCMHDGNELFISDTGHMKCGNGDAMRSSHHGPICQWRCTYEKSGLHGYSFQQNIDPDVYLFSLSQAVQLTNIAGSTWVSTLCNALADQFKGTKISGKYSQINGNRKGIPFPPYWDDMGKNSEKKIQIHNGSGEWNDVAQNFAKTLSSVKIISIERIQNTFHWEMFFVQRLKMENRYGKESANERKLFHGTSPDRVAVIRKHNLDPRLAGESTGTVFGQGTYFSPEARISDMYTQRNTSNHKFMFQAKVLVGQMCPGSPSYRRPPPQNPDDPLSDLYDSCVNDLGNPSIFCVFHDSQYYLEYIIEYI